MPRLRPPFYEQEKDNSCLPACLRMALAARGLLLTENQVRELCDWSPRASVSSTSVVAAARALGFIHSRITGCGCTICVMNCAQVCFRLWELTCNLMGASGCMPR